MMLVTPTISSDLRTRVRQQYGVSGLGVCDTAAEIMGDAECVRQRLVAQHAAMYAHDLEQARTKRAQCEADNALNVPANRRDCAAIYPDPPASNYVTEWQAPSMPEKIFIPLKDVAASVSSSTSGAAVPRVTFQNLSGGSSSTLRVGDRWRVSITGGRAGERVSVTANGATKYMGDIDSSGNFSVEGVMTAGELGHWNEEWTLGGFVSGNFVRRGAGSFSFEVIAPETADTTTRKPPVTPSQNYVPTPGTTKPNGTAVTAASPWQAFTGLLSNPLVLLGGGALLLGGLAFSGRSR